MNIKEQVAFYDSTETKDVSIDNIRESLKNIKMKNDKIMDEEDRAELLAFTFVKRQINENEKVSPLYGELFTYSNGEGYPTVKDIKEAYINYWEKRVYESKNPLMKARYSGLVWEYSKAVTGKKPSFDLRKYHVSALLNIYKDNYFLSERYTLEQLERALKLALKIGDKKTISEIKTLVLNYEPQSLKIEYYYSSFKYKWFLENKKTDVSDEEKNEVLNDLENTFFKLCETDEEKENRIRYAKDLAVRICNYNRKKGNTNEVTKIIESLTQLYTNSIKEIKKEIDALHYWEEILEVYKQFELTKNPQYINILKEIRENGLSIEEAMETFETSIEIPNEHISIHCKEMIKDTVDESLKLLTRFHIPRIKDIKEQLEELKSENPFTYLINTNIIGEKGRTVAVLKPINEDLEGYITRKIVFNFQVSSIFLSAVIEEGIKENKFTVNSVFEFLKKSPLIREERQLIIKRSLKAYFEKDYIAFTHIIIPQIEEALREILVITKENELKESKDGYSLFTMDEILRKEVVEEFLTEDIVKYFISVYTSQKGWNLRNELCHGLLNDNRFNYVIADRVFHTMLCLGLVKGI